MMGAISDLCESLSKLSGVPAENVRINADSSFDKCLFFLEHFGGLAFIWVIS